MIALKTIQYIKQRLKQASIEILFNDTIALDTSTKGFQDLVTQKDYLMEDYIMACLKEQFPTHEIISEEQINDDLTDTLTWVLDPIDGTVNFSQGSPLYGIQMALLKNKAPQVSIMYFPAFDEFHYAIKNRGYFVNDKQIKLDQQRSLNDSIITFGDFSKSNPSSRQHQLKFIEQLMDDVLKTRIQGSSSIDFSFIASGKTQGHIIFSKNLWELKPGFLLVEEAGGIVHQYDGEAFNFEGKGYIVASNETILKGILKNLELLK